MKPEKLIPPGLKRITVANWKEMDDVIQFPFPMTEETWVRACLKPQLKSSVPEQITALFEVARGSMIYGWFFYPLITLATEQLHRVLDAGARARCEQLSLPTKVTRKDGTERDTYFSENIAALVKAGEILKSEERRWDANRELRNWASHPSRQSIHSPGMGLHGIDATVELLNSLFK